MTVAELIEKLKGMPGDAPVVMLFPEYEDSPEEEELASAVLLPAESRRPVRVILQAERLQWYDEPEPPHQP